jgi:hypothetical protein
MRLAFQPASRFPWRTPTAVLQVPLSNGVRLGDDECGFITFDNGMGETLNLASIHYQQGIDPETSTPGRGAIRRRKRP